MTDKIIVDANVFVAIVFVKDSRHQIAEKIFSNLLTENKTFVTNNYLYAEALTIALLRSKNIKTVVFLEEEVFRKSQKEIEIFSLPSIWRKDIVDFLIHQQKYHGEFLSFSDCSLIVQARKQKIKTIFTFDKTFRQFAKEFKIIGI